MGINRHRLLAPLAIGAAALSLAGASAAFAADSTHSPTTTGTHLAGHSERSLAASRKETTADVHTDRTKDSPGSGLATPSHADTSKDPVGTTHAADVRSEDPAASLDR